MARKRRWREVETLDVTAEVIGDYDLSSPLLAESGDREVNASGSVSTPTPVETRQKRYDAVSNGRVELCSAAVPSTSNCLNTSNFGFVPDDAAPPSGTHRETAVTGLFYLGQSGAPEVTADDPLQASLGPVSMHMITGYLNKIQAFTPEGSFEDGIFLAGSAYHELHSTSSNHLVKEIISNVPGNSREPTRYYDVP